MNNDVKIEYYLLQLDRELQAMPVSQRAEIITEIKSHIRGSQEKDAVKPLDQILKDLGTPREVAERYLVSMGLPLSRPQRRGGVLKWLAIGTVAFFALIFMAGMSMIWYFSPIVKIDEKNGRVALLGGLIDVNEEIGQVKVGDMVLNNAFDDETVTIQGEQDLTNENVRLIKIPFNTAKIAIRYTNSKTFSWDCEAATETTPKVEMTAGILTLNLDRLNLAKCEINLPSVPKIEVRGVNGHMEIKNPHNNLDIELNNGKVNIKPDPDTEYDFDVRVKNGLQDFFPRSANKDAVKVKVSVVNGMVKKE